MKQSQCLIVGKGFRGPGLQTVSVMPVGPSESIGEVNMDSISCE